MRLIFVALLLLIWLRTESTPTNPDTSFERFELTMSGKSLAFRNKNAGNLVDFKTGKLRKFKSFKAGIYELRNQIERYKTGRSIWTDSNTNLKQYCKIYSSDSKYLKHMVFCLKVSELTKIKNIETDSLIKYHMFLEDINLFKQLETWKMKKNTK